MFRHHRPGTAVLRRDDRPAGRLVTQRYHFDLVDRENAIGVAGHDDDEQAMKVAPKLAPEVRQVRPELIGQGCEILIGQDDGGEFGAFRSISFLAP